MTTTTSPASTSITRSAPVMVVPPHSGRTCSISPSTRSTTQRRPRGNGSAPSWRTDQAVPRSSALPTAPGGRSSSRIATSPISPPVTAASPDARNRSTRRRRKSTSELTDSTEKRSHWSHAGPRSPTPASAPTTSAAMPKKTTKKPPGVRTSIPSNPRPRRTHPHHVMRGGHRIPRPAGGQWRRSSPAGRACDRGRLGLRRRRCDGGFLLAAAQALDHVERHGNDEDGDEGGGEHPAHHARPEDAARDGARALGGHQRHDAEDEGEGGHQDRTQAEPGGAERGVDDGLALVVFLLGELDDEDGVLRRETDQHDEADLREDVVVETPPPERGERAEDGDRDAQQHAEGERPALVLRRQDQEHRKQREAEHHPGRHALRRHLLLEGHPEVVEAHLLGHGLAEDLLERCHPLAGAVAGLQAEVHEDAAVLVVAHRELGTVRRLHGDERRQRD